MSIHFKRLLLRANAIFLLAASTGGFLSDVRGIFFGLGPVGRVVAQAPDAGIGFIEAHGLASSWASCFGAPNRYGPGTSRPRLSMSCSEPPILCSGSSSSPPACC